MWQLVMTNTAGEWTEAGSFETLAAAARRIREIEGYPVSGVLFELLVETEHGTEEEAFSHLEHTGRHSVYVLTRRSH